MDIADLTRNRLNSEAYDIPGVGRITVRGLSRFELLLAGKLGGDDVALLERHMISMAVVHPITSVSAAEAWQKAAPAGELQPIVALINQLSGVGQGADKSRVPGDGGGSEPGVGALHSGETVDDGGAATG